MKISNIPLLLMLTCSTIGVANVQADPITHARHAINDSTLKVAISNKINTSPILTGLKISTKVDKGIVRLTGETNTETQFQEAVTIAESTKGVRDVDLDNLSVKTSDQLLTDLKITAKIKGSFARYDVDKKWHQEKSIPALTTHVKVETKDGNVVLTGTVGSDKQKKKVLALVHKVHGIKSVRSKITVKTLEGEDS